MKNKILLLAIIFIVLIFTGCSNNVEYNILDVQNSELIVTINKQDINSNAIDELSNIYNIEESKSNYRIKINIKNTNIKESFKENLTEIKKILEKTDTKAYNKISELEIEIDSSIGGYPFSAFNTLNLKLAEEHEVFNIYVKPQGIVFFKDKEYEDLFELSSSEFTSSKNIQFNTFSIDKVDIIIEVLDDYRTVISTFDIESKNSIMRDIKEVELQSKGFSVNNVNESRISISRTYTDMKEFEFMYNMDLLNMFNILSQSKIEFSKNVINSVDIELKSLASSNLKNVNLILKVPVPSKIESSGEKFKEFEFKMDKDINENISNEKINFFNLIMIILIFLFVVFVTSVLIILKKRGSHIRIK